MDSIGSNQNSLERTKMIHVERRFICADLQKNQNKFWYIFLEETNGNYEVYTTWGRVGDTGSRTSCGHFSDLAEARNELDKRVKSKLKARSGGSTRNAYKEVDFVDKTVTVVTKNPVTPKIKYTSELSELMGYLQQQNIHDIHAASKTVKVDTSGVVSTPLGVVSLNTINEARGYLHQAVQAWQKFEQTGKRIDNFDSIVEKYINLIPQDVGRKRLKVSNIFRSLDDLRNQNELLDMMAAALDANAATAASVPKDSNSPELMGISPAVTTILLLDDAREAARLRRWYDSTSRAGQKKVKRIFRIDIPAMTAGFEKATPNHKELFHGSAPCNILSILCKGFIIPPEDMSYCSGRAYGNGVYGADTSQKSAAYANKSGGSRQFMFVVDFAMGKIYECGYDRGESYPARGCDSTHAKRGDGLLNDEMIVYRISQVLPKYILELE